MKSTQSPVSNRVTAHQVIQFVNTDIS